MEIPDSKINEFLKGLDPNSEEYADMKEMFLSLRKLDIESAICLIPLLMAQESGGMEKISKILQDIDDYFDNKK
jgi:hypothetical protein